MDTHSSEVVQALHVTIPEQPMFRQKDRAVLKGPSSYCSMISTVILVRRAGSWNAVGDLRSIGMSPG